MKRLLVKQSLRLQRSACTSQKIDYSLLIFARDALHWLTEHTSTVHCRCALHFSSWVLNPYPSKHYLWSRNGLDGPKWQRMDDWSPRGLRPRGCTVKISWRQIYFERSRPVASPRLQAMATSLAMCLKRSLGLLVHPSIVARLSRPL